MRNAFVKVAFLTMLSPAIVVFAQHHPASARDLFLGVMEELGSSSLKDASLSGTVELTEGSTHERGQFTAKTADNGFSHIQLELPTVSRTETRKNTAGGLVGSWTDAKGTQYSMAQHNLLLGHAWFLPQIELIKLLHDGQSTFSYIGSESKYGQSLEHFTVTLGIIPNVSGRHASSRTVPHLEVYLDPRSLRPAILAYTIHPDDNGNIDIPVEIRYSNYVEANHVWMPSHIERYINFSLEMVLSTQTSEFNTRFPEALAQ